MSEVAARDLSAVRAHQREVLVLVGEAGDIPVSCHSCCSQLGLFAIYALLRCAGKSVFHRAASVCHHFGSGS